MNAFRVIWKHHVVEHDIAGVVVQIMESGDVALPITQAMAQIDRLLTQDPIHTGESRGQFERILVVEPLVVEFEV